MAPTYTFANKKILVIAAIAVAVPLMAYLFLYRVQAQSVMNLFFRNDISLPVQAAGVASAASSTATSPMLETHIANNGLVYLSGARVVSISGTTLDVSMDFSGGNFIWTVQTNSETTFPTADSTNATLADIQVGDIVEITGMLAQGGTQPTIEAQFVRKS